MTMTTELSDVSVNIQTGWLAAASGTPIKKTINIIVIPAIDEDHAHEIWKTMISGFNHVDSWGALERAPGYRMFVQTDNLRRYITIYINHNGEA